MGNGLAIGVIIEPTVLNPKKDNQYIITAIIVSALLTLSPLIFSIVLWKNKSKLHDPRV